MPKHKGRFIPPKLSTSDRNALTPFTGETIYNTTTKKLETYDGTVWVEAGSGGGGGGVSLPDVWAINTINNC